MRYKAFLSYSHQADSRLVAALHTALLRFAKPWYKLRALHNFRDTTNLAVNPNLWQTIEQALGASEFFVLFASEKAAQSFWVQRELTYWITNRPLDHLFIVLTDGDLVWDRASADFDWTRTTSLPRMLAGKLTDEPLFLDLRWAKTSDQLSLRHPRFRDAVADLAAPLHGRPKDELIGEDILQYRRTWRIAAAGVLALAVFAAVAVQQRNEARHQQRVAEEQRDESRRRLVQLNVNNGTRLGDEGDLAGALLWYAEAAKLGVGHGAEESLLRERISATERAHPLLEHVWFTDQAVLDTVWLDDSQLAVLLKDGSGRVWTFAKGAVAEVMLQRPDTILLDVTLIDGRIHVLGAHADSAVLWDVASGRDVAVLEHQGPVVSASFSRDRTRVVTASADGTARVWDRAGQLIASLRHAEGVAYATFSADASKVLTYTDNETAVHIWNLSPLKQVTIKLGSKPLEAQLSPDGREVVTLDEDGVARLWSTATGKRVSSLGDWEAVKRVQFSPDGKHVAMPTWSSWIHLHDVENDTEEASIQMTGMPLSVSFSDDSKRLVASANDLTVRVWKVADATPLTPVLWHDDFIHEALLSPDGTRIATSGSEKGVVRVWKLRSGAAEQARYDHEALSGDGGGLRVATLSRDASRLLTAGDFVALVWGVGTGAPSSAPLRVKHGGQIYHAAFSLDGNRVLTCTEDGAVTLWDVRTGEVAGKFPHDRRVEDADFSPDGTQLATASGSDVCIWDAATQRRLRCMRDESEEYPVTRVQFDPRGRAVLAKYFSDTVRVWDVDSGQSRPALERHDAHFATYSPDGRWIATAEDSLTVHVQDASTGVAIVPAIELTNRLKDMAFSPDSSRLLTAAEDGTARVWTVASAAAVTPPLISRGSILAVAFSPDGRQVATAGDEVRVWDASTGAPLTPVFKVPEGVRHVEFSADGRRIVGAGLDGSARIWDLSSPDATIDDLVRLGHAYAVRRLDEAGALLPLSTDDFRRAWSALHAEQ